MARRGRVGEAEDVQPLDEEGPLLRIERLELSEIHHSRIDFNLAEVGIERAGEGEARGEGVLEIDAAVAARVLPVDDRIVRIHARAEI